MSSLSLAAASAPERIVIDTDPGRFTDDNVAITMCARSPERLQILGITVVSGNVWAQDGIKHARHTAKLLDLKIPIHLGAQRPLVHTQQAAKGAGPVEFRGAFDIPEPRRRRETAVDFLIDILKREPQPVTILALGPLTNIAQALERDPSIAAKIKRLVIMGGQVHVPGNSTAAAEFNFWFDPEAADRVLRHSAIRDKILVPLDVCNHAVITKSHFDRLITRRSPIANLYRQSFGNDYPGFLKNPSAKTYFWDELAAAFLLDETLFTSSSSAHLAVETAPGPSYGTVRILPAESAHASHPVRYLQNLDFERAFRIVEALFK